MALLSPLLKEVLVCPVCRGELEEDVPQGVLRCKNDGRTFPVRDNIAMMLVQDADPAEEQLTSKDK